MAINLILIMSLRGQYCYQFVLQVRNGGNEMENVPTLKHLVNG